MAEVRGTSTLDDLAGSGRGRIGQIWHWVGVAVLLLLVVAALAGWLGPREGTTTTAERDYSLTLIYPEITRAGQPAPLHLRVEHPGGFAAPVRIAVSDAFFDHLDFQSWYPSPSAEIGDGERVVYEFDPPPGEVFELSLDARTSPGQFGGVGRYEVGLRVEDRTIARTSFTVWTMP